MFNFFLFHDKIVMKQSDKSFKRYQYQSYESNQNIHMKKYSVVDLFAGCGGLSLGLENSGFDSVYVNELNNDAL